ncbi:MAG TPA: hypothetical protein VLU99_04180 [Nitrososphaerales archaeon]|nr:hypothetical protein [Nitrososphaerales archaeon]
MPKNGALVMATPRKIRPGARRIVAEASNWLNMPWVACHRRVSVAWFAAVAPGAL